jgi:hypothetical protein
MAAKDFGEDGILRLQALTMFTLPDHQPKTPPIGAFISAGMLFGPGELVKNVPYDPNLYFYGEEITYATRLWTSGYDIYNPDRLALYHLYKNPVNPSTTHWQDHGAWAVRNEISVKRVRGLLDRSMNLGKYGFGTVRTIDSYEQWSGIDFKTLTISQRALSGLYHLS